MFRFLNICEMCQIGLGSKKRFNLLHVFACRAFLLWLFSRQSFPVFNNTSKTEQQSIQANIPTLVSHVSPQWEMLNRQIRPMCAGVQLYIFSGSPGLHEWLSTALCKPCLWSQRLRGLQVRDRSQSHGGTGPGEHQPAGPLRVPLRSSSARFVRSCVHHAEVCTGSRTSQLPLGLWEGRGGDHGHQRGAGEFFMKRGRFRCSGRSIVRNVGSGVVVHHAFTLQRPLCLSVVWGGSYFSQVSSNEAFGLG